MEEYEYLEVYLDNKLNWGKNVDTVYKKGQSRVYFLRRLRSSDICKTMLRTFYASMVASAIMCAVICWASAIMYAVVCGSSVIMYAVVCWASAIMYAVVCGSSVIMYAVVCWSSSLCVRDTNGLNKNHQEGQTCCKVELD